MKIIMAILAALLWTLLTNLTVWLLYEKYNFNAYWLLGMGCAIGIIQQGIMHLIYPND